MQLSQGEPKVDALKEIEMMRMQSDIRAGINTEKVEPSRVISVRVEGDKVVEVDLETGEPLEDEKLL